MKNLRLVVGNCSSLCAPFKSKGRFENQSRRRAFREPCQAQEVITIETFYFYYIFEISTLHNCSSDESDVSRALSFSLSVSRFLQLYPCSPFKVGNASTRAAVAPKAPKWTMNLKKLHFVTSKGHPSTSCCVACRAPPQGAKKKKKNPMYSGNVSASLFIYRIREQFLVSDPFFFFFCRGMLHVERSIRQNACTAFRSAAMGYVWLSYMWARWTLKLWIHDGMLWRHPVLNCAELADQSGWMLIQLTPNVTPSGLDCDQAEFHEPKSLNWPLAVTWYGTPDLRC